MNAYFLFDNLHVSDSDRLEEYARRVAPVVASHGGKYRILGERVKVLEGQWKPAYPVLIEFDSFAQAEGWYRSDDYAPLKRLRQSAVKNNGVLIEGLATET